MRNRAQHEKDTNYVIAGVNENLGGDRRKELLQRVDALGIPRKSLARPEAGAIIDGAAGLDVAAVHASWRVASGFAHGRYWPYMRAGQPQAAHANAGGYLISFALDEAKHAHLATACDDLLRFADGRYQARSIGR